MSEPVPPDSNQAGQQDPPQDAAKQEAPDAPKQETMDEAQAQQKEEQAEQKDEQKPATEPGTKAEPSPPKNVTDDQIKSRLHEVLKGADLNTLTEKQVRKRLEKELETDLSGRKDLIRKEIEAWLESQQGGQEDGDGGDEEEDEDAEEEDKGKKRSGKGQAKSSGKAKGGFTKHSLLSPALSAFVGAETMSRPQVVKSVWEYIKKHNLQDPKNKRNIICDDKLKTIFTPPITMFSMNKQLSKHCFQNDGPDPSQDASDGEEDEGEGSDEEEKPRKKAKTAKGSSSSAKKTEKKKSSGGGGGGGFNKPVQLDGPLADFFGETSLSRPQITRRFWDYFKENNLQNPRDKREIMCDDKLKGLFGVDKFRGFSLQKLLKPLIAGKRDA
ncbi:upstream activation factor subunit spp27-like protein [Dunaliella salina]|uniref:Upstream activation factor subunit spp27-like protein n=1 Tax=Dunaliella salina TaxID=3046 RepID=A0ABQ7GP27_DUNSA|nr:upstream activation factor subunit spp27-like protein [Dunaliella salina]|eukprot:KAF5836353.1 upstream activation factor subunit spp27-like protein [Dunaliella salina]